MAWLTAGKLTDPTDSAILADTGPLSAPINLTLLCWTNVPCQITIRHRNAANTLDLHTQQMGLSTEGNSFTIYPIPSPITVGANERLILTLDKGFVGQIQCSFLT